MTGHHTVQQGFQIDAQGLRQSLTQLAHTVHRVAHELRAVSVAIHGDVVNLGERFGGGPNHVGENLNVLLGEDVRVVHRIVGSALGADCLGFAYTLGLCGGTLGLAFDFGRVGVRVGGGLGGLSLLLA